MYNLLIERHAEKGLKKIPKKIAQKIIIKIQTLKNDPKPAGLRKIVGSDNDYRLRIGDYRIIYELKEREKEIIILAIGHRKDIYREI